MHKLFLLSLFLLTGLTFNAMAATSFDITVERQEDESKQKEQDEEGFESLFDGETLKGWSGAEGFWTVEEGAITGRTTKDRPTKGNTFLIWQGGDISDFELRLKFRIIDGNSGVQFRSKDLGDHRVSGYQADIDASNTYIGILYEEKGRGILCPRTKKIEIASDGTKSETGTTCDEAKFLESLEDDAWNEFIIRAEDNSITQSINGFVTAEVIDQQDEKSASQGILALQLHAGPPMCVQFKDIRLLKIEK